MEPEHIVIDIRFLLRLIIYMHFIAQQLILQKK